MANETILLLASEPVIGKVICEALESRGYFVLSTNDLSSSVERLKDCAPHLLMVRPYTETGPGHEAAMYLRSLHPGIPVMIVGGILDDPRLDDRETLNGFEVFPKPFKAADLLDAVKEMLGKFVR
jgi:DNA-binding NtrC family response regulator